MGIGFELIQKDLTNTFNYDSMYVEKRAEAEPKSGWGRLRFSCRSFGFLQAGI